MSHVLTDKDEVVLRFGRGASGNPALITGWGEPEDGFVWSEGKYSTLELTDVPAKPLLSLSLWGYTPNGTPVQDLLIFVNGILLGAFEISDRLVVELHLEDVSALDSLKIGLYIPSATSPQAAQGSVDTRRLGIALASIRIASAR